MDPLTGLGIAAASSFVSGLFGKKSQDSTNKTNLQIARETNEMNYKIWQEQQQHNLDMYNLQNEDAIKMYERQTQDSRDTWQMQFDAQNAYNTPAEQRKRYEDAGFNPYLMMGQGSAGNATSSASSATGSYVQPSMNASPAPTMQAARVENSWQSFISSATGLGGLVDSLLTNDKKRDQIDEQNKLLGQQIKKFQTENAYLPHLLYEQWLRNHQENEMYDLTKAMQVSQMENAVKAQALDNAYRALEVEQLQAGRQFFTDTALNNYLATCQTLSNMVADGKIKQNQAYKLALEAVGQRITNDRNKIEYDKERVANAGNTALLNDPEKFKQFSMDVMNTLVTDAKTKRFIEEMTFDSGMEDYNKRKSVYKEFFQDRFARKIVPSFRKSSKLGFDGKVKGNIGVLSGEGSVQYESGWTW